MKFMLPIIFICIMAISGCATHRIGYYHKLLGLKFSGKDVECYDLVRWLNESPGGEFRTFYCE